MFSEAHPDSSPMLSLQLGVPSLGVVYLLSHLTETRKLKMATWMFGLHGGEETVMRVEGDQSKSLQMVERPPLLEVVASHLLKHHEQFHCHLDYRCGDHYGRCATWLLNRPSVLFITRCYFRHQ